MGRRLADAHYAGRLQTELVRLGRYPLLVGRRGRLHPVRTRSREPVLPTRVFPLRTGIADCHVQQTRRPLGRSLRRRRRGRAAMIDRLVHHAEVVALKGDKLPAQRRGLGRVPAANETEKRCKGVKFRAAVKDPSSGFAAVNGNSRTCKSADRGLARRSLAAAVSTAEKHSSQGDPERALSTSSSPVTSAVTFNDRHAAVRNEGVRGSSPSVPPMRCLGKPCGSTPCTSSARASVTSSLIGTYTTLCRQED
jgi:hypothetical protein